MIAEALLGLQKDPLDLKNTLLESVSVVHLIKSLPVIWNQSVGWLNKAYHAVNDPAFIKKVCMLWFVLIVA